MKKRLMNHKYILVKEICIDCERHEGQLMREGKGYCVQCYAKRFGEVTVKLDK